MESSPVAASAGRFLLVACRGGAEAELVRRQEAVLPQIRKAAWRRGVVTFRLDPPGQPPFDPPADFFPDLVFGRACIHSLGQVTGHDDAARVAAAIAVAGTGPWQAVHVWPRDPACAAPLEEIRDRLVAAVGLASASGLAAPGDQVLDCVIDSPERWWVGWHRAATPPSRWPGGIYPGTLAPTAVSRAWLKLDEAVATFELRLERGQRAVELGAAPGGASQRLLEAGLDVVGIDPALVDPVVAAHPRFTQWRKRARDVKLREFRGFDWLVCDMNIDPVSTMESLGRIATAPGVRLMGIIATLKLPEWSRAAALPEWLDAFRAWGFRPQARQLSTGGREVCVVARPSKP
jgi:23S rRNA (cytidine2498-2'-O)-methyltransferase